jgi:cytidine deaminase
VIDILTRAQRKATTSRCNYKVVAIGINNKGEVIGIKTNKPAQGMSDMFRNTIHAEEVLILSSPPNLKVIYIARVGRGGDFLPIDPCNNCRELADKRGIKIRRLEV